MHAELDRERWERIATVFGRALDAGAAERAALLDQLCGSDRTIRGEVEAMLDAHERGDGLLAERRLAGEDDPAASASSLAPGTRVGPYRIVSEIGSGGMGDVHRAERADGAYSQTVALKVLRPGYRTAEMVRRFRIEREAVARLAHPCIVPILDGGTLDDGRPWLAMQYAEGVPITRYCAERSLSVRDRLALFARVADAVQFAHGHLVVHRDIKPSNILVDGDGTPRLLDFGIAKLLDSRADASLAGDTRPELRLFTPEYAAPEQLLGEPPGTATDIHALGVLLFEMLTGVKPFAAAGRTASELERAILEQPAPVPSAVTASRASARQLRGDLDRVVMMALRKEPERRYASAAQMAEDVERHLAGRPVIARPDSTRYRVARFVARNRALVAGGVAAAVLLTGFAATATVQARRIARERDRADRERVEAEDVLAILTGLFERADPNKHPGGDTLRVTALLDDAEQEVERLGADPERQSALWRAVGRMRAARGEYARAIALLTRAYERRRALSGERDIEAARTHHEIAQVMRSFRGEAAARPMLDSSLAELRALLGEDHEEVKQATSDLLLVTSDSLAARALLARVMEMEQRAPSRDPVAIAERLNARGADRLGAGRPAEAASLFQASLEVLARAYPPEHEDLRTVRRNLAVALRAAGETARAESLQRAEVALEERIRAPAATRGQTREALALTLAAENRADAAEAAEAAEREALALFRASFAPEHWRIWSAERNLAFIAAARGRVGEGLDLLDSAIARAGTGADSATSVGYLVAQRVPFLLRLDRVADAARSIAIAERRLGASASVSVAHRADVDRYAGMVAMASGDAARAAERFRAAVSLTEPPDRAETVPGLATCLLGVALAASGRMDDARAMIGAPCSRYEASGLVDSTIVGWIQKARAAASRVEAVARR
jgi:serine/threonine-protein kinase